jgi:hypothetical protein
MGATAAKAQGNAKPDNSDLVKLDIDREYCGRGYAHAKGIP